MPPLPPDSSHDAHMPSGGVLDVAIIGGGLSGLTTALALQQQGIQAAVLEADEHVGGRIQTDEVKGYKLDRGFQVYNTGYLEANSVFDLGALNLQPFYPGAIVRYKGAFHKVGDPQRDSGMWLYGLYSKIGNFQDKVLTLKLKNYALRLKEADIFQMQELTTLEFLRAFGFSDGYIEQFFLPFYGGVLLEPSLATSAKKFLFTFQSFARGDATLPVQGMQALPEQLAYRLNEGSLWLSSAVIHISAYHPLTPHEPRLLTLGNGRSVQARAVVMATPIKEAFRLLGETPPVVNNGTVTLYFGFEGKPPLAVRGKTLMLNGEGAGMMQHLCFVSEICRSYAPANHTLLSVTLSDQALPFNREEAFAHGRKELKEWFGPVVERWEPLGHYPIAHAIPAETLYYGPNAAEFQDRLSSLCQANGLFIASDACTTASINGAIQAGLFASQQVMQHLQSLN
jgi:phytoene dehydrogenase-like protein